MEIKEYKLKMVVQTLGTYLESRNREFLPLLHSLVEEGNFTLEEIAEYVYLQNAEEVHVEPEQDIETNVEIPEKVIKSLYVPMVNRNLVGFYEEFEKIIARASLRKIKNLQLESRRREYLAKYLGQAVQYVTGGRSNSIGQVGLCTDVATYRKTAGGEDELSLKVFIPETGKITSWSVNAQFRIVGFYKDYMEAFLNK
jgi:hypothetical protein